MAFIILLIHNVQIKTYKIKQQQGKELQNRKFQLF